MCDSSIYIFAGPSALRVRGLRRPDELRANPPPSLLPLLCFLSFGLVLCVWLPMCRGCDVFSAGFLLYLQAFFDLENGNQELKSDLKDLYINNAM